jgi:hypothetical protein
MEPGSVRRSEEVWAPWQGPQQRRRDLTPAITATSPIGLTEPGRIGAGCRLHRVYIDRCSSFKDGHFRWNVVLRYDEPLMVFHRGRGDMLRLDPSRRYHCQNEQQNGRIAARQIQTGKGQLEAGCRLLTYSFNREVHCVDTMCRCRAPLAGVRSVRPV